MAETTARLAEWIAEVPRGRIAPAHDAARVALRDVVGCMLAGSVEETPRRVAAAVTRWGAGRGRVLGSGLGLPAPWAALVNGAAAHVLDYDDTFAPLAGHATAVLVPALLALGEEAEASNAELLDALVVGLEVLAVVGRGVNRRHYALGWHATATIGALGAAGACARLMRLPAAQARDALSLSVSMASGMRMQLGAMVKPVHAGLAAKAGVLAATLAAEGVGGAEEALEGPWRFAEMFCAGEPGPASAMAPPADDAPLAIHAPGLSYKPYPTCAASHLSLDGVLALRAREGFSGEDVEVIETSLPLVLSRNLMHPSPRTGMEARFSMQYCLALAAVQGRVGLPDFEGEAIHRAAIRALMPRVAMQGIPEEGGVPPTTVSVRLRDGRVLEEVRVNRRGSPADPMTEEEHLAKFFDCASVVLSPERARAALDALGDDVVVLVSALT